MNTPPQRTTWWTPQLVRARHPQDAVLPPDGLQNRTVPTRPPSRGQRGGRGGPATPRDAVVERRRQAALRGIAERVREVVRHLAAGEARDRSRWGRSETVGVVSEPLRVHALELDGEVRSAAVVLGVEAVRLAASGRADLDHLHADAVQRIEDGLARGAGPGSGEDEEARQVQRR